MGVPYFGVLIIRILLFRVLYWGPLLSETPILPRPQALQFQETLQTKGTAHKGVYGKQVPLTPDLTANTSQRILVKTTVRPKKVR